jgi:predicted RNase H-like HicB family nuclease
MPVEFDREADGRWIAAIPALPGVLAYGVTREEAEVAAQALALRVIGEMTDEELAALLVALGPEAGELRAKIVELRASVRDGAAPSEAR